MSINMITIIIIHIIMDKANWLFGIGSRGYWGILSTRTWEKIILSCSSIQITKSDWGSLPLLFFSHLFSLRYIFNYLM